MRPSHLTAQLRSIADKIDRSKNPNRATVSADLRAVLAVGGDGMGIKNLSVRLVPPEMPEFAVQGEINGTPFKGVIRIDLDGRELEYEAEDGSTTLGEDNELLNDLVLEVYETDAYKAASEAFRKYQSMP